MRLMEALRPKRRRMDVKSAQNVPEEIIRDILLMLPIKSLLKFTAVCKSWRSLIRSSAFINTHLSRQNDRTGVDQHQLLLIRSMKGRGCWSDGNTISTYSLHLDNGLSFSHQYYSKLENPVVAYADQIRAANPSAPASFYGHHDTKVRDVGTCNGLVCLALDDYCTAIIWNPCIRKFLILPRPTVPVMSDGSIFLTATYGFGYDSRSNDYKVLRIATSATWLFPSCKYEIWSLAKGSWQSLSAADIPPILWPSENTLTFINGSLYWMYYISSEAKQGIVSFDLSTESFGKIVMPQTIYTPWHLSRHEDSLVIFDFDLHVDTVVTCISMWVMREFGIGESWTKLFSINLQIPPARTFAFNNSREVVLLIVVADDVGVLKNRRMDLTTQKLEDFGIEGTNYGFMDCFVESLVLLDQPNASSY